MMSLRSFKESDQHSAFSDQLKTKKLTADYGSVIPEVVIGNPFFLKEPGYPPSRV
jgi:hypothetical protein